MNIVVTITYSTDDYDYDTGESEVNNAVAALLESALPYMVDNVAINFDTEES